MAKVMISMPDDLLEEVDDEVRRRRTTRSSFLASAARSQLRRPDSDAVTEAVARSQRRFAETGRFESSDLIRADRDVRP